MMSQRHNHQLTPIPELARSTVNMRSTQSRLSPIVSGRSSTITSNRLPPVASSRLSAVNGNNNRPSTTGRLSSMNLQQARNSSADGGPKIKVMLRCKAEDASPRYPTTTLQYSEENPNTCVSIVGDKNNTEYTFDYVFDQNSTQDMIYEKIGEPVIAEVLKGYSCTIFAYGQTNTGKTYTMEGNITNGESKEDGIIPRTIRKLFQELGPMNEECQVTVSMMELYNEDIRDLLSPSDTQKDLSIYEVNNKFKVKGITERPISTAAKGLDIMKAGVNRRTTATTNMNERSSRSHCIFTITVHMKETTSDGKDVLRVGRLHLVDLAGSENSKRAGSQNQRKTESGNINKSLLTLGRVIQSLVKNEKHIPYRESKLTCILKDSLGGHTKTYMIATIAPRQQLPEDIKSTLDYASLAKDITNKPQTNPPIAREGRLNELSKTIDDLYDELNLNYEKQGVHLPKTKFDTMKNDIQILKDEVRLKDEEIKMLKNKEKQHKEEKARLVEDWKSKVGALDDTITSLKDEKQEMAGRFSDEILELNNEFNTKLKKMDEDYRQKEQQMREVFQGQKLVMQKNMEAMHQRNEDHLNAFKRLRTDLTEYSNDTWDLCMSTLNRDAELVTPSAALAIATTTSEMNGTSTHVTENSSKRPNKPDMRKSYKPGSKRGREDADDSLRPTKVLR